MTRSTATLPALTWYDVISADAEHRDQDTDLAKIGSPGGAEWAGIADQGEQVWSYGIYSRWLWEDIDADPAATLHQGLVGSEQEAKNAVASWVAKHA